MDDKRTSIAIFLCIVVVMVYSEWVFAPYKYQAAQQQAVTAANQVAATNASSTVPVTSSAQSPVAIAPTVVNPTEVNNSHPSPAQLVESGFVNVKTDKVNLEITKLGARFNTYQLLDYRLNLKDDKLYDMVSKQETLGLPLAVYTGGYNDEHVKYSVESLSPEVKSDANGYTLAANQNLVLRFVGILANGVTIEKIFTFNSDSYLFNLEVKLSAVPADGSRSWLEWSHYEASATHNAKFDYRGFVMLSENKLVRKPIADVTQEVVSDFGTANWSAFADMYFMSALIPASDGVNVRVGNEKGNYLNRVAGLPNGGKFTLYVGPKEYKTLEKVGFELKRNIDLGWFAFLAHPMLALLRTFYAWFANWGIAIVLLTLVIKAAFLPLAVKSFKSMQSMQELQPEIKALRERIKDPNQLNAEMMALYKKRGVNPMGGCLPMLIQIPVFLGLYNSLLYSIELRHAPFALWIHDLSAPEALMVFGYSIPVMVLLMGASMFIQTWMTPSMGDPMQRKMMLFMPIVFTFMFMGFPAGLTLYWLVNNLISIVQQAFIRNQKSLTPGKATLLASLGIFGFVYIITLI